MNISNKEKLDSIRYIVLTSRELFMDGIDQEILDIIREK